MNSVTKSSGLWALQLDQFYSDPAHSCGCVFGLGSKQSKGDPYTSSR